MPGNGARPILKVNKMVKALPAPATAAPAPVGLPPTAAAIMALPPVVHVAAQRNNALLYADKMLFWVAPLPAPGWPAHVLASGAASQALVQGAGATGITFSLYKGLKGSVSRLRHMQRHGAVVVKTASGEICPYV